MQYIQLQGQVAADLDTPLAGGFNLFIDTNDGSIKSKDSEGNISSAGGGSITDVTYSQLYNLYDSGSLTPGQYYKITDYQTCYDQPNFDSARNAIETGNYKSGSVEQLIVFAISTDDLSPNAYSIDYPKDTIKYNVSVTQTEVTNGLAKGRIYERMDEVGNRTDYDWRAVQFKRYNAYYCEDTYSGKISVTSTETTASVIGVGTDFDNSFNVGDVLGVYNTNSNAIGGFDFYEIVDISGSNYMGVTGSYYSNINDTYYSSGQSRSGYSPFQTNTVSVGKTEYEYYTFEAGEGTPAENGWYNNYLGDNLDWDTFVLSNNVFRDGDYRDNHFGSNVVGNTFDDEHYGNNCGMNFQYNILEDNFDNNQIGDNFKYNFFTCDMDENIIGNDFQYNMWADYEGIDFSYNIINGGNFQHNWSKGDDDFTNNIISADFSENVIYRSFANNVISDYVTYNFFDGSIEYNQFKQQFSNNKIYDSFRNNVLNRFYNNIVLDNFDRNHLNGNTYDNILSGSFYDNNIGHRFYENTFLGETANNEIGVGFNNNVVGDSFGVGGGDPRANKIGNNIFENVIGEYFYSNTISDNFNNNTIGDYFQQNTILANNINNVDFNQYYGNIFTATLVNPNIGEVADGTFTDTPSTSPSGIGTGATFDVTITSGVASVTLNQSGKLYVNGDTLFLAGSVFGSDTDLELTVDSVSPTPVVYANIDSTIVRNYNEDLKLTYIGSSFGIVGITEPVD